MDTSAPVNQPQPPAPGALTVRVAASGPLYWAAAAHRILPVVEITVVNGAESVVRDLTVELSCEPGYLHPASFALTPINPGAEAAIQGPACAADLGRLKELIEAEVATLTVRLRWRGTEVATAREPLMVLAHNEWHRAIRRDLIAAFVMPNHPAIRELVSEASQVQQEEFGRTELDGYQSGSAERVKEQAAAVYGAIQKRGITYLGTPASFEEGSQKVRFPEALRQEKQGNCIEVATWYAAALEACGLRAVLVLLRGHAFAGFWLTSDASPLDSIETDASVVRGRAGAAGGLGSLVLVETTSATTRPPVSFRDACSAALAQVTDDAFHELIDISAARLLGIRPLNAVVDDVVAEGQGVPVDHPDLTLPTTTPLRRDADPGQRRLTSRFEAWIDTLVDPTLRNELIGGTMADDPTAWGGLRPKRGITLAVPDVAAFENDLADGVVFRIGVNAPASPPTTDHEATVAFRAFLAQQQERRVLVADPGGKTVPERVKALWKKHGQSIEEKGISALHVAIGFLRWYESESSAQARYAPLLMVPAHLERISVGGDFTLRMADAEAVLNTALVQKLRREFDIDLSGLAADLPEDDCGIDVPAVFAMISDAVVRRRRFEVVAIATLGMFDYRKQVMAKDLQAIFASGHASPNDFLARLEPKLGGERIERYGNGGDEVVFPEPRRLDELVRAADLPLVVDCDSSQLSAVQAALAGKSFVLQGPPGTGKSQTIANMIACLLAAGRRVLFVAEKRAALSVVAHRLARAGLGSACLELYSEKADPGVVSATLVNALDGDRHLPGDDDFDRVAQRVEETRTRLNAFVQRLHEPTPLGLSFFRASARRHALRDCAAPAIEHDDLLETTRAVFEERLRALGSLEAAIRDCGGWREHPLRAVRLATWTERRQEAAAAALAALARDAHAASAALDAAAAVVGIGSADAHATPDAVVPLLEILAQAPPAWVRELSGRPDRADYQTALAELGAVAARHAEARDALAERWNDGFFAIDAAAVAAQIRAAQGRWVLARWLALRGPRATLRGVVKGRLGAPASLLADLDLAIAVRRDAATLDEASAAVAQLMGPAFAGARTPAETFGRAEMVAQWDAAMQRLAGVTRADATARPAMPAVSAADASCHVAAVVDALARVRSAADHAVEVVALDRVEAFGAADPVGRLRETAAFANGAAAALPRLRDKTASEAAATEAEKIGLRAFVSELREGRVAETEIARAYEAGFLKAWVAEMTEVHPILGQFRGREHDRVVEAFRHADRELFVAGQGRARRQVLQRRPAPTAAVHAQSEVGILRREAARRRRRMPVRRLLAELPTLVPRLTPCLLMSPLAVAHFLPVECEKFDAVIFDEASQVRTADAVGALWRGRQVIVVGDPQQMPPTDFFTGGDGGDELVADGVPQDAESVLDEAFVSGVPRLMLAWHYRSRDERLIAFSNRNYYGNGLVTFPAADPEAEGCGVEFVRVPGVFDRGASRRNEVEARRVVELIVERLRDPERRQRSIGVVTFNIQQQDLIETLLEEQRLAHPEIEPYFSAAAPEPVFVKNLENVQGDERDVMIFSTTFGKDATGRMTLNFGPMNRQGGERRLNVAVTRARERLIVVSSMDPEEIDLSRTGSLGVRHLREFLAYARDGVRALQAAVSVDALADCESPFEEDVLSVCESLGWRMDRQVGCSGYRIDLAARDPALPGRHVLGIECDGATYHSAATARDRDRLRQAVLENLGWTLHRIWSTDWRLARDAEIARLRQAYDAAAARPRRPAGRGANGELKPPEIVAETAAPVATASAPPRVEAAAPLRTVGEPIDPALVTHQMRREAIVAVLHASGAMPRDALIRAAAVHVGHQRVGSRIRGAFEMALQHLLEDGALRQLGDRIALGD
jgi:very-short-patch-repair endonuclease